MKPILLIALALACIGCDRSVDHTTGAKTPTEVLGPDKHGVVCYVEVGPNNRSISCVKVYESKGST